MYEVRRKPLDQLLDEEELHAQNALAEQIMEQLVKAQRTDELSALSRELAEKVKG